MTHTCPDQHAAYRDYGIDDATRLVHRTYYRLAEDGFEPTPAFADALGRVLRDASVSSAAVPIVPEPIEAAIGDAVAATMHEFLEDPDADLRTEVLPHFAGVMARAHCRYAHLADGNGPGVHFDA